MPFVLNPSAATDYVKRASGSSELGGVKGTQWFSFKKKDPAECKIGYGRLNVCPSSYTSPLCSRFFENDVSFRTLYRYGDDSADGGPITVWDLFDRMPSV